MSRAAVGALLLLALALALAISTLAGRTAPHPASSRSKAPEGRLAAALLLEELDLPARRFEAAPLALAPATAVLWMPFAPDLPPHLLVAAEDAAGPALEDPRHALHYRSFVEQGGTLVLAASAGAAFFLERVLGIPAAPRSEACEPQVSTVRVLDGGELRVDSRACLVADGVPLRAPPSASGATALVVDGEGRIVALRYALGSGAVVLLGADEFLTNAGLPSAQHAELFVQLIEALAPTGVPQLFDEFALGGWAPQGKVELALSPGIRGLSLHLVLLALLWAWCAAWPREFPRDPPPHERRSPLERARAQAALLARAGHYGHLALRLRSGVLRRLAGRLRLSVRDVERPAEREAVLRELELRAPAAGRALVRELLVSRPVQRAAELEELGAQLLELERSLLEGTLRPPRLPLAGSASEDVAPVRAARS